MKAEENNGRKCVIKWGQMSACKSCKEFHDFVEIFAYKENYALGSHWKFVHEDQDSLVL